MVFYWLKCQISSAVRARTRNRIAFVCQAMTSKASTKKYSMKSKASTKKYSMKSKAPTKKHSMKVSKHKQVRHQTIAPLIEKEVCQWAKSIADP